MMSMVVPKIAKLDTCELGAPHNLPAQWLKLLVEGFDYKKGEKVQNFSSFIFVFCMILVWHNFGVLSADVNWG